MAAQSQLSAEAQLQQLGDARAIVLADPAYWPQVFYGTLPIISGPLVEVRRWGADFLAETFSTPIIEASAKQGMAQACLEALLKLAGETEAGILKSVVQCSASIYPIIFRYICENRNDADTWNKMAAIKAKILSLWDQAPIGVQICCIKFVQRVILVQSRGVTDPRLVNRNETSLATVPSNHPLLSLPSLDAEAQGLLDRLLSILQEGESDPSLITATLNNLPTLIKSRPPMAQKVVSAVLAFNPFAGVSSKGLDARNRLIMMSMEKTTRVLLMNVMRTNPSGPFVGRISQHLARLSQLKQDVLEEASKKRAAPPQDLETAKRLKVERVLAQNPAASTPTSTPPPAPTQQVINGPMSYAQLYTLATDPAMTSFDGHRLPIELVLQIVVGSMYSVNQSTLTAAIAAIRDRYNALLQTSQVPSNVQSQVGTPDAMQVEPPDKLRLKDEKQEAQEDEELQLQLGDFRLPPPPKPTEEQLQQATAYAIDQMFELNESFEKTSLIARKSKLGVNRLAASSWDREGWISVVIRLIGRGLPSDELTNSEDDYEPDQAESPADRIRDRLFRYIVEDFRTRMDVIVAWLNEEWYIDKMGREEPQYQKWLMKVMDSIFPFLESKDRLFMRVLSEIPEINGELLGRIKRLCLDPDRTVLGVQMLHYLAMLRPPVRGASVDVLEDLWENHPDVRPQVQKLLQRWRPSVLLPRIKNESDEQADSKPRPDTVMADGVGTNGAATPVNA